jgi:hypothetical protein
MRVQADPYSGSDVGRYLEVVRSGEPWRLVKLELVETVRRREIGVG